MWGKAPRISVRVSSRVIPDLEEILCGCVKHDAFKHRSALAMISWQETIKIILKHAANCFFAAAMCIPDLKPDLLRAMALGKSRLQRNSLKEKYSLSKIPRISDTEVDLHKDSLSKVKVFSPSSRYCRYQCADHVRWNRHRRWSGDHGDRNGVPFAKPRPAGRRS
jgi:hypothetical protein